MASLADYYAPAERRFWLFIIPELIGFACIILLIVYGKTKKNSGSEGSEHIEN